MVILFSDRKSVEEREIVQILTDSGATYISDKEIKSGKNSITVFSAYKKTNLNIKKGIVIMLGGEKRFYQQKLPVYTIGICDSLDKEAVNFFANNTVLVISCGMGRKNTVTFSSIDEDKALLTFQRTLTDIYGNTIEPAEYKNKLKNKYREFSVMASATILLLYGIKPEII